MKLNKNGVLWSSVTKRSKWSKIPSELRSRLQEWITNHPDVVNSPLYRDMLWRKKEDGTREKIPKLLITISIRQLHNDMLEYPQNGGLTGAKNDNGEVYTDLDIFDFEDIDNASYVGIFRGTNVNLSNFITLPFLGKSTFQFTIDGKGFVPELLNSKLKGKIDEVELPEGFKGIPEWHKIIMESDMAASFSKEYKSSKNNRWMIILIKKLLSR